MTDSPVLLDRQGSIALLTLNRPEKLNALSAEMFASLNEVLGRLAMEPDLRVLIITGAGRAFCAGTDIEELSETNPARGHYLAERGQELCNQVERFPAPVIAAVNGIA